MPLTWKDPKTYELTSTSTDLSFGEPWRMVCDLIEDATDLKIVAEGEWTVAAQTCDPNGLSGTLVDSEFILKGCPFGALLGKVGGSSALHLPPTDPPAAAGSDQPFAIGAYCVFKLPSAFAGPLFIGFNAVARPIQIVKLKVTISSGRVL